MIYVYMLRLINQPPPPNVPPQKSGFNKPVVMPYDDFDL